MAATFRVAVFSRILLCEVYSCKVIQKKGSRGEDYNTTECADFRKLYGKRAMPGPRMAANTFSCSVGIANGSRRAASSSSVLRANEGRGI